MPELSSFYVAVHTGQDYSLEDYDAAAGRLVVLLTAIFSNRTTLLSLTHNSPLDQATSEIEVGLEGVNGSRELVGKVVVDMMGAQRVKFDKAKLSKQLKVNDEWPNMKVLKQQVPRDD